MNIDRLREKRRFIFVEILDKRADAPFIAERNFGGDCFSFIAEIDLKILIQKGKFAETFEQDIVIEDSDGKDRIIGQEGNLRPLLLLSLRSL